MITTAQTEKLISTDLYTGVYTNIRGSSPTITVFVTNGDTHTYNVEDQKPSAVELMKSTVALAEKENWDFGNLDSTNYKSFLFK